MDDAAKDALRAKVTADNAKMQDALAPFYVGKHCPLNRFKECLGMGCPWFLLQQNENGKIASGACAVPLGVSQIGPITGSLVEILSRDVSNVPRVIGSMGGH
jgi:hypothetical protein